MLKNIFKDFLLMLQFMTRLPVNLSLPCESENFKRGAAMLPLVGLIIGLLQWVVFFLLIKVLPLKVVAALVVLCGVLITGALHIDGLGDTCDGFYAFKGRDKIIEIMKDSRIGTYACLAIIFDVLLKFSSIASLPSIDKGMIIIAVPIISRAAQVFLFSIGKTAKSTGSGNLFIGNVGKSEAATALAAAFFLSLPLLGMKTTIVLFLTALAVTLSFNYYCNKKIGGLTGDTLGANNELVEITVLLMYLTIIQI